MKVVVFDDEDLAYARWISERFTECELFLSVGTDVGQAYEATIGA